VALAQADPELNVMLNTPPATPDKVRLEFREGILMIPPTELAPDPRIVVEPTSVKAGGVVRVSVSGLAPLAAVRAELQPGGAVLADWIADQDGAISASLTLPAGLVAGSYNLVFWLTGADPPAKFGSAPITVEAAGGSLPRSATDVPAGPPAWAGGALGLAALAVAVAGWAAVRRRLQTA
jgi:alpha-L-fucosidase